MRDQLLQQSTSDVVLLLPASLNDAIVCAVAGNPDLTVWLVLIALSGLAACSLFGGIAAIVIGLRRLGGPYFHRGQPDAGRLTAMGDRYVA